MVTRAGGGSEQSRDVVAGVLHLCDLLKVVGLSTRERSPELTLRPTIGMIGSMKAVEEYIRGWRERDEHREESCRQRAEAARALIPKLVQHLVDHFQPRSIWLIGSLVEGGFHQRSDIDLVVAGIPGAAIYRAGAQLDDLASGDFEIDLIPAEDANEELLAKTWRNGEHLYGD